MEKLASLLLAAAPLCCIASASYAADGKTSALPGGMNTSVNEFLSTSTVPLPPGRARWSWC